MRTVLVLLALTGVAHAQPADCDARPVGPNVPLEVLQPVGPDGAAVRLPLEAPAFGTRCRTQPTPPGDTLRGRPAPGGIMRNGSVDVLRGVDR